MIFLSAGVLGGFISGLMGVGTAAIYVPLMLYLGYGQLYAQSIALIMIVPASIISVVIYYKYGAIKLQGIFLLLVPAIIGSFVGSYLASILPVIILRKLFGVSMVYIAYKIWRS
ncbi:MAG: sulfite exporter TauE/SafE family protein [Candidatus Margulisbacteria bacterium]|nr:sulfite exporter TauE/SafE family protein [Candidatus Margulisiibacteriota bacterium]